MRSQDYQQLESIIQFFRSRKQSGLEKYFPGLKMKYGTGYQHYGQMDQILAERIVNKPDNFRYNPNYVNYSSRSAESDSITIAIAGFNHLKFFALNNITEVKTDPYEIDLSANGRFMNLYKNGSKVKTWDLSEKIRALKSSYGMSSDKVRASEMVLKYTTPSDDLKVIFSSINQSGDYYSGEAVLVFK